MAKPASKYPNFAAEMTRSQLNYDPIYKEIAERFNRSVDTVSNWFTGRAGELPTAAAFAIKDKYFPMLTVDYLFSETPMLPTSTEEIPK